MSVLKLEKVSYHYANSKAKRNIIQDKTYKFDFGKLYGIVGKSGAGKTTLLSLLAGLTKPTEGKIIYNSKNLNKINSFDYRAQNCGVIFQQFNLLPQLTALENVMLAMDVSGKKYDQSKNKLAKNILRSVELPEIYDNKKILQLSGGEQQRVACARALAIKPDIILADEPTGNLDSETQNDIINIFDKLAHKENKCVIIVTHSQEVAKRLDMIYELKK
ncbi:MAG: ABC transporter ATP-binding protein [Bifidobacteriaceae bacterium]|jgi:putative ABC transport system ATP-binding protein|nr:ABC transporter ATP-binding protein [Bifidobacteriaceae bacterium]